LKEEAKWVKKKKKKKEQVLPSYPRENSFSCRKSVAKVFELQVEPFSQTPKWEKEEEGLEQAEDRRGEKDRKKRECHPLSNPSANMSLLGRRRCFSSSSFEAKAIKGVVKVYYCHLGFFFF